MYWPLISAVFAAIVSDLGRRLDGDVIGSSTPHDRITAVEATTGTTRLQRANDLRPFRRLVGVPILVSQENRSAAQPASAQDSFRGVSPVTLRPRLSPGLPLSRSPSPSGGGQRARRALLAAFSARYALA